MCNGSKKEVTAVERNVDERESWKRNTQNNTVKVLKVASWSQHTHTHLDFDSHSIIQNSINTWTNSPRINILTVLSSSRRDGLISLTCFDTKLEGFGN